MVLCLDGIVLSSSESVDDSTSVSTFDLVVVLSHFGQFCHQDGLLMPHLLVSAHWKGLVVCECTQNHCQVGWGDCQNHYF